MISLPNCYYLLTVELAQNDVTKQLCVSSLQGIQTLMQALVTKQVIIQTSFKSNFQKAYLLCKCPENITQTLCAIILFDVIRQMCFLVVLLSFCLPFKGRVNY